MKIAYINEFPEVSKFQAFMQEYECSIHPVDEREHVIAAYDNNRLVAIGFAARHLLTPIEASTVHVLSAYAQRGIEGNVVKLLLAECKFSPKAALTKSRNF
jgi:hypothetical protein